MQFLPFFVSFVTLSMVSLLFLEFGDHYHLLTKERERNITIITISKLCGFTDDDRQKWTIWTMVIMEN